MGRWTTGFAKSWRWIGATEFCAVCRCEEIFQSFVNFHASGNRFLFDWKTLDWTTGLEHCVIFRFWNCCYLQFLAVYNRIISKNNFHNFSFFVRLIALRRITDKFIYNALQCIFAYFQIENIFMLIELIGKSYKWIIWQKLKDR